MWTVRPVPRGRTRRDMESPRARHAERVGISSTTPRAKGSVGQPTWLPLFFSALVISHECQRDALFVYGGLILLLKGSLTGIHRGQCFFVNFEYIHQS